MATAGSVRARVVREETGEIVTLGELLQLFNGNDRALLHNLLRAAASVAQSLSGMQLAEPPLNPLELPAWLVEYDRVATAANAPSYSQWLGVSLNPLPQEPALPWPVVVAQYAQREPGIATALREAAEAYAAITREGSPALARSVSDVVIRRWAQSRLQREAGTSPTGSGAGPRDLTPGSNVGLSTLALGGLGLLLLSKAKGDSILPLLALGGGALLLGSRSGSRTATRTTPEQVLETAAEIQLQAQQRGERSGAFPLRYAREKEPQLLARWRDVQPQTGSLGDALMVYAPRVFPGIPPVAFLGFTAIATSRTEITTANELGYFQTPRGTYERLLPEATRLVGREVSLANWRTDVEGQTAVGLLSLHRHFDELAALGWTATEGSVWQAALTFAGFSAGTGGVNQAWRAYRQALEQVPDRDKFNELGRALVRAWDRSTAPWMPRNEHPNPAHTWLRTAQKLESARLCALALERETNETFDSGWFVEVDQQAAALLVHAAAGRLSTQL